MQKQVDIVVKGKDESAPASAALARLEARIKGAEGRFKSMASVAAGAFAGFSAGRFLKSSIEQFIDAEKQSQKLESALRVLGKGGDSAMASMRAFATEVMNQTTLDDDAVLGIASLGASLGKLSGDALRRATVAAIGLSRSLQIDVETAMRLVSKAAQGNFATFSRYGIKLDENASAQVKFNQVLDAGTKAFALAQDETSTLAGQLERLKVSFGNLQESIGGALAPALTSMTDDINVYITKTLPAFEAELGRLAHKFLEVGDSAKSAQKMISDYFAHPTASIDSMLLKATQELQKQFEYYGGGDLFHRLTGINKEGLNARVGEVNNQIFNKPSGPTTRPAPPGGNAPVGVNAPFFSKYGKQYGSVLGDLFGLGDYAGGKFVGDRGLLSGIKGFGQQLNETINANKRAGWGMTALNLLGAMPQAGLFGFLGKSIASGFGKAKSEEPEKRSFGSATEAITSPFVRYNYSGRGDRDIVKPMVDEQKKTNVNLDDLIKAVRDNKIGVEPIV